MQTGSVSVLALDEKKAVLHLPQKCSCIVYFTTQLFYYQALAMDANVPRRTIATLWLLHNDWITQYCGMTGHSAEMAEKACIFISSCPMLTFSPKALIQTLLCCRRWRRSRRGMESQAAKWEAPRCTMLIDSLRMPHRLDYQMNAKTESFCCWLSFGAYVHLDSCIFGSGISPSGVQSVSLSCMNMCHDLVAFQILRLQGSERVTWH